MPATPPPTAQIAALLNQAEAAWASGQLDQCEQCSRDVLALWPESAMAWNLLGMVASRHGQLEHAAQLMVQAARLDATHAQIRTNLGIVLSQLGEYAQATQVLTQALEIAPNHESAWMLLGQICEIQGQFVEQAACLRQAHQQCPQSVNLQLMLSDALNTLGEHAEAARLAEDITRRYPQLADGWSCLGCALEKLARLDDARGIIWPDAMAPFQVAIVPMGYAKSEAVRTAADALYAELQAAGIDAFLDDRDERPGSLLADNELIGTPHRVVIGDRGLKEGVVEYQGRRDAEATKLAVADVAATVIAKLKG